MINEADPPHEATAPMEPRIDAQNRRLCSAHNRAGELCRNAAMTGQRVCRSHGGATKASRDKAKIRLAALVDPAIATLGKEMVHADTSRDRQSAANSILDRTGWGRVTKVDTTDARDLLLQRLKDIQATGQADSESSEESEPDDGRD